jgi:hypothetical protein
LIRQAKPAEQSTMFVHQGTRTLKGDLLIATLLLVSGLALSSISLIKIANSDVHLAQATQPLQSSPPVVSDKPADSKPGGERPTTPAPEPAHPNVQAQKEGTKPALPPAPAEKIAPPIQQK